MRPRPPGRDSLGIHIVVTLAIVLLDMFKVGRVPVLRMPPVHALEPIVQHGILATNHAEVALEVLHVDGVEADQRAVHAHVQLRHVLAEDVRAAVAVDDLLQRVQCAEDWWEVLFVRGLVGCEAGFVDACVQVVADPVGNFVDGLAQMFGVEGQAGLVFGQKIVECSL